LHTVLNRVLELHVAVVQCDSCFIYVLENDELIISSRDHLSFFVSARDAVDRRGAVPLTGLL